MEFPFFFQITWLERQTQRERDGASAAKYYSEGRGERESLHSFVLDLQVLGLSLKSFQNKLFNGKLKTLSCHTLVFFHSKAHLHSNRTKVNFTALSDSLM